MVNGVVGIMVVFRVKEKIVIRITKARVRSGSLCIHWSGEWIPMDWNTMMRAQTRYVLILLYLCAMRLAEFCNTFRAIGGP